MAPAGRCGKRSTPEPVVEAEHRAAVGPTAGGGREPGEFASDSVRSLCRTGAYPAQAGFLNLPPRKLAGFVGHDRARPIAGVGSRQAESRNTARGVGIGHVLVPGQGGRHQHRTVVGAQILRLVGPVGDEPAQVEPRGGLVLVQVEGGEALRRIPAAALLADEGWIQRVGPAALGDPPPGPAVGEPFDDGLQRWASAKSNISRQAASTSRNRRCPARSSSDRSPRPGAGRRTTAGIRSRFK